MFENVINFFKGLGKNKADNKSKDAAKERLHLVLMQDRANISADFLALMKQEIIEVIKKYIDVDENAIDVRLTNKSNEDGTTGAPVLYANIPFISVKEEAKEEARKIKNESEIKKEIADDTTEVEEEEKKEEVQKKPKPTKKTSSKKTSKKKEEEQVEEKKEETISEEKTMEEETHEVIEKAEEIVEELKEEKEESVND